MGAALWPGPLCATISIGEGSTAHTTSTLKLEDYSLPPAFEVLTVTITSTPQTSTQRSGSKRAPPRTMATASSDGLELPIAQFDILLPGLGLEERWRLVAQRQRAQAIHLHSNEPSRVHADEKDEEVDAESDLDDVFEAYEQAAGETSADDSGFKQPGTRTTVSSNVAVTSTSEDAVRLQKHASWERVGLHTTRAPAYPGDRESSTSPLPSPISPCVSTEAGCSHEVALARPKIGDGCFIDIGLSLMGADDVLPNHNAGRCNGASGGPSSPSGTPNKTKVDKALGFFFEFEEPIEL
jgi:hypothetical protein